ncbi:MAG TPA: SGNH/GDSL hydrolase family protein [Alphaproteobacteria bacterium]
MNFRRATLAAIATLCASIVGVPAGAAMFPYDRLVVFGDSLSDTGNAGRFSNGLVWVEYLADGIGAAVRPARDGGTNFAVGGARTHGHEFSLRAQVAHFLALPAANRLDARTLVIVYAGANDLRAAVHAADRAAVIDHALHHVQAALEDLAAAGARRFLVPNLPDIGRTPEARAFGPDWVREARSLTLKFNAQLEQVLRHVEGTRSVHIHRLDVFKLLEQAVEDPGRFGFRNVTVPCPYRDGATDACSEYVFWDDMHPTTFGHARLAEAALRVLSEEVDSRDSR